MIDNDLMNHPPAPDDDKILFSPDSVSAFLFPACHAQALGMGKELLQQKGFIAKVCYDDRMRKDPNDNRTLWVERGWRRQVGMKLLLSAAKTTSPENFC